MLKQYKRQIWEQFAYFLSYNCFFLVLDGGGLEKIGNLVSPNPLSSTYIIQRGLTSTRWAMTEVLH